jgi:hypothetical protein
MRNFLKTQSKRDSNRRQPGFNGQGVKALVDEILQGIIHKAMAGDGRLPGEQWRRNFDPEMCAKTGVIGANMAMVLKAFIHHFKRRGLQ